MLPQNLKNKIIISLKNVKGNYKLLTIIHIKQYKTKYKILPGYNTSTFYITTISISDIIIGKFS